jgi:hypothetical protein
VRHAPAQAEQQQQLCQPPVAAPAAAGQAEFTQLLALDWRQRGNLSRHAAPEAGLRHGCPGRLLEHAEEFVFPFPMPVRQLAPHDALRVTVNI